MFQWFGKMVAKNYQFDDKMREIAFLLGGLAWLEKWEGDVTLEGDKDGWTVSVYKVVDGTRVRVVQGQAETLSDAIKTAADIYDRQQGFTETSVD